MKHAPLALCALLLLAPAGALLSGCSGGSGFLSPGTGSNQNSANLTVTPSSGSNFGASPFTVTKVTVTGDSSASTGAFGGFGISCTDANQDIISIDGTAITPGSFSVGQSFDLTKTAIQVALVNGNVWGGPGNETGILTVKSVSGTRVTFLLTGVGGSGSLVLSPEQFSGNNATGTIALNGTITANIPVHAPIPVPVQLKRKVS